VNETFLAGKHFDKGTERHDPRDLTGVHVPRGDILGEAGDGVDSLLGVFRVCGTDQYRAVILDID
jgi:hypothetical protein